MEEAWRPSAKKSASSDEALKSVSVKVGLHSGVPSALSPHRRTGRADYFGPFVNTCARVAASCVPGVGQVLLTGATVDELHAADEHEMKSCTGSPVPGQGQTTAAGEQPPRHSREGSSSSSGGSSSSSSSSSSSRVGEGQGGDGAFAFALVSAGRYRLKGVGRTELFEAKQLQRTAFMEQLPTDAERRAFCAMSEQEGPARALFLRGSGAVRRALSEATAPQRSYFCGLPPLDQQMVASAVMGAERSRYWALKPKDREDAVELRRQGVFCAQLAIDGWREDCDDLSAPWSAEGGGAALSGGSGGVGGAGVGGAGGAGDGGSGLPGGRLPALSRTASSTWLRKALSGSPKAVRGGSNDRSKVQPERPGTPAEAARAAARQVNGPSPGGALGDNTSSPDDANAPQVSALRRLSLSVLPGIFSGALTPGGRRSSQQRRQRELLRDRGDEEQRARELGAVQQQQQQQQGGQQEKEQQELRSSEELADTKRAVMHGGGSLRQIEQPAAAAAAAGGLAALPQNSPPSQLALDVQDAGEAAAATTLAVSRVAPRATSPTAASTPPPGSAGDAELVADV